MPESLQNRPESVSEETEETLSEQADSEFVLHLEKALNKAEEEEVKFEIRQALQYILT